MKTTAKTTAVFEANRYEISHDSKVDIDSLSGGDVVYIPFKDDCAVVFEVGEIRPDHAFGLLSSLTSYCMHQAGCQLPESLTGTDMVVEIDKEMGIMVERFAKVTVLDTTIPVESVFTPPITSGLKVIKRN